MKVSINLILFLFFWTSFSQSNFDKMPENTKEIHFIYEKKSNYVIDNNGVYGDSILFAIDFPKLKTILKKNPKDSTQFTHFVSFKNMNKDEEKFLWSSLYHTNEIIKGTYFISSKTLVFYITRNDEETKKIFKKYFSQTYYKFEYRQEFNYITRIEKRQFPSVNYNFKFDEIEKTIVSENNAVSYYTEERNNINYKNSVSMNENLSKYITPIIFTNNAFGVEKLESIKEIINLISVTYK